MILLTPEQISDLGRLRAVAEQIAADVTIIGATALQCFMDLPRFTNDIDLVVALDLDAFATFADALQRSGWSQQDRREHRWRASGGSIVDILPAGPGLRAARRIIWPQSQFAMSLVGFEHVFARAVAVDLAADLRLNVAPPAVIALLKIVAFMDDQQRRKDLDDLRFLLHSYEAATDRIFGDGVFEAELEDIDQASALLLGMDIAVFAADEEIAIVERFLESLQLSADAVADLDPDDLGQRDVMRLQRQLRAFAQGFRKPRLH